MRGLLRKDIALLKNQKIVIVAMLCMLCFLSYTGSLDNYFIMGYIPFVCCFICMSSISYDEFDNGLAFLLTLPASRKQYVAEKYLFGIFLELCGILISLLIGVPLTLKGSNLFQMWFGKESFFMETFIFLFVGVFLSVMIPVQLKFGSEKARFVLFGIFIGIMGIGYLVSNMVPGLSNQIRRFAEFFVTDGKAFLVPVCIAVFLFVLTISYRVSVHIMKKKEF